MVGMGYSRGFSIALEGGRELFRRESGYGKDLSVVVCTFFSSRFVLGGAVLMYQISPIIHSVVVSPSPMPTPGHIHVYRCMPTRAAPNYA